MRGNHPACFDELARTVAFPTDYRPRIVGIDAVRRDTAGAAGIEAEEIANRRASAGLVTMLRNRSVDWWIEDMKERFHPPVRIEWGHAGQIRSVTSSREIAELLMDDRWPRSVVRLKACETAIAYYDGRASIKEVRVTFEEAAREAHILIEKRN